MRSDPRSDNPCEDCDENPEHGTNTEQEMDVDDDHNPAP